MDDRTPILVVVAVLLAVGMAAVLYWLRSAAPDALPKPPPVSKPAPTRTAVRERSPSVPGGDPQDDARARASAEVRDARPDRTASDEKLIEDDGSAAADAASWEFSAEELADTERPVYLDLGDYQVAVGQEFEVALFLEAPALSSLDLVMVYDKELLEAVEGSEQTHGRVLREGMLFRINDKTGHVGIFSKDHGGLPGKKNLFTARNERIASFRMRAEAEGATTLSFVEDRGISFKNGLGVERPHEVFGGRIVIR